MKAVFTFLAFPAIVLICLFSQQLYVSGSYIIAYMLVLEAVVAFSYWIHYISLPLATLNNEKQKEQD